MGESVEGSSGVFMFRRGKKTDSMELHRHADPGPPDAITLRARKASLYGHSAGRYWDRVLRGEGMPLQALALQCGQGHTLMRGFSDPTSSARILQPKGGGVRAEFTRFGKDSAGEAREFECG